MSYRVCMSYRVWSFAGRCCCCNDCQDALISLSVCEAPLTCSMAGAVTTLVLLLLADSECTITQLVHPSLPAAAVLQLSLGIALTAPALVLALLCV
jgi:hypothetical protein